MGGGSCLNDAAFGRLLTLLLGMAVLAALFLCSNSLSSIFFVNTQLNWLSVDFNNWKDWEDDSDEDMSNFDRFSEMMNNMGGDDDVDLPEVDGADDDSPDSDDEKMPDLE